MVQRSPRWPIWGIVLALIAGVGPISGAPVHAVAATPTPGAMVFRMVASGSRATICTGDSAPYSVVVNAYQSNSTTAFFSFPGFTVEGYPNDKGLGSFAQGTMTTRSVAGGPPAATFMFKAGSKPGKTALVFQGRFPLLGAKEGYVSTSIAISVVECQFQISAALRFSADRSAGVPTPAIVLAVHPTKLHADPQGHVSASAPVHWFSGSASVKLQGGTCTGTLKFAQGDQVTIDGQVREDGVVRLTFNFPPALGSWTGQCNGFGQPMGTLPYSITPLDVYFRPGGGVTTLPARISSNVVDGSASFAFKNLKAG